MKGNELKVIQIELLSFFIFKSTFYAMNADLFHRQLMSHFQSQLYLIYILNDLFFTKNFKTLKIRNRRNDFFPLNIDERWVLRSNRKTWNTEVSVLIGAAIS